MPYYTANFDPTFIYVIFWVGIPVSSLLLGNWFSAFSPWRAFARGLRWLGARLHVGWRAPLAYPAWLGRWPVVAGLIAFGWLELIYHDHDNPTLLASLSLAYFVLMLVGHGAVRDRGVERARRRLRRLLRPAFTSLLANGARGSAVAAQAAVRRPFALAGAGNGRVGARDHRHHHLRWGVQWSRVEHAATARAELLLRPRTRSDPAPDELADSLGLLFAIAVVVCFYRVGILGMRSVSGRFDTSQLSRTFAHTLVPIGFAYVLAHYFSLLIWQGQAIGYLASNPLGHGTNYFGTAGWHVNYAFIGSTGIWYVQVLALVTGHVSGLALAHDRALATYRSTQDAVRSQYWMLVVMVGFTSLGLWLLSAVNT